MSPAMALALERIGWSNARFWACADGNVQHAKAVPPEAGDAWAWMPLMAMIDNEKEAATSTTRHPLTIR